MFVSQAHAFSVMQHDQDVTNAFDAIRKTRQLQNRVLPTEVIEDILEEHNLSIDDLCNSEFLELQKIIYG